MQLAHRLLYSNFDGVMTTDFTLQDKRQTDGAPFHYIVTLFHLPFLEARDRLFHTTQDSLPLLFSGSRFGSEEKLLGPRCG